MPTAVLNAVWKVDTKALEAGLANAKNKMQSAGSSITGVGKTVTKVAAVSVGAIGAIALKANSEIAGAGRTIRSTTGATGPELEGLKKSFEKVFTAVPTDAATAAQAISTLHQRTGLTGKGLEDLAAKELTLARITKEDLGGMMENTTRLFGDWSYRIVGLAHLLAPRDLAEDASVVDGSGRLLHRTGPVFAIFAANTRVLGGGLVLPIDADPSDGLLDLAIVPRMPRMKLLRAFLCFARGRPVPDGTLSVHRAARAVIDCARAVPFSADGDLMCRGTRFELDVLPGALALIC